jgi:hypothetical protein
MRSSSLLSPGLAESSGPAWRFPWLLGGYLLHQFTDEQLASSVPTVVGEQATGDFFAGRAGHATGRSIEIEAGWRQRSALR